MDAYTDVGGRATQDAKAEVIGRKRLEPVFQTKPSSTFQVKTDIVPSFECPVEWLDLLNIQ
ncbi:MAG: hypothetical protein KAI15_06805 [Gammaproteobacteria bacterium]|nr:hypothetical protein [Gammaproteobacteria bacterium]